LNLYGLAIFCSTTLLTDNVPPDQDYDQR